MQRFRLLCMDPHNGSYADLYSTFDVDPNNINQAPQPAAIKDLIAAAATNHQPLTLAILNSNAIGVLLCPQRVDRALGAPQTPLPGRFFAFDGDLHRN